MNENTTKSEDLARDEQVVRATWTRPEMRKLEARGAETGYAPGPDNSFS
jgi:hypothetical protein